MSKTTKEILIVDSVTNSLKEIKETECVKNILNLLSDLADGKISDYHKFNDTNFLYIEECILGTDITIYFSEDTNHFKILDIEFNAELCA